jgi:hypothetical protein
MSVVAKPRYPLLNSGATPGSYTLATLTIDAKGRVTSASAASVTGTGSVVLATGPVLDHPALSDYLQIANGAAPSTPTAAGRIYFDSSNRLSWKGTNGWERTFDGTANTANRIYVLPDAAGTVVLDTATQTLTNKTLTSPAISGGTINNAVIGGTTPADITGNIVTANTRFVGSVWSPATNGIVKIAKADGATAVLSIDTSNTRLGVGRAPSFLLTLRELQCLGPQIKQRYNLTMLETVIYQQVFSTAIYRQGMSLFSLL